MSVSNFKFVSPGVFINEIDNSEIPAQPAAIGPVVIGRSRRGLAMQPIVVDSFSEYVEQFGETVPGREGGDIWRDGNFQSPMYGTYAAKAFLRSTVAPVTYMRLLGQETTDGASAGGGAQAGWKTTNLMGNPSPSALGTATGGDITYGGAYGLWVFPSGSSNDMTHPPQLVTPGSPGGTIGANANIASAGILAAIWYMNSGSMELSGTLRGSNLEPTFGRGTCQAIGSDTNGCLYFYLYR